MYILRLQMNEENFDIPPNVKILKYSIKKYGQLSTPPFIWPAEYPTLQMAS
jgi:hypothetical protein